MELQVERAVALQGRQTRVLIVESEPNLGATWQRHLEHNGFITYLVHAEDAAIACLQTGSFDVIVMDLVLESGAALAIADFASFRHPETKIVFVTDTSFFSDGSIFRYASNACALVRSDVPPDDLVALVEHHGQFH